MFRVEDRGIGMPAEQVAELNELPAGPVPPHLLCEIPQDDAVSQQCAMTCAAG